MDIEFITGELEDAILSGEKLQQFFRSIPTEMREAQLKEFNESTARVEAILTAVNAVADEIESGVTDFDELRVLASKHVFDAGGDPDDLILVDAVVRCAELTANGSRVIGRFERLVA